MKFTEYWKTSDASIGRKVYGTATGATSIAGLIIGSLSGDPIVGTMIGCAIGGLSGSVCTIGDFNRFNDYSLEAKKHTNSLIEIIDSGNIFIRTQYVHFKASKDIETENIIYSAYFRNHVNPFLELSYLPGSSYCSEIFVDHNWTFYDDNFQIVMTMLKEMIVGMNIFTLPSSAKEYLLEPIVSYEDDITGMMDSLLEKIKNVSNSYVFDSETLHLLHHTMPNDVESLRELYLSLSDVKKQSNKEKMTTILSSFEHKIHSLIEKKENEIETKIEALEKVYQERYQI